MRRKNIFLGIGIIFLLFALTVYIFAIQQTLLVQNKIVTDPYENIPETVAAKFAIIYDVDKKKVLAGRRIHEPSPIASITKLYTSILAEQLLSPSDVITIDATLLNRFADKSLSPDTWILKDLLGYAVITSNNALFEAIERAIEKKTGKNFIELIKEFIRYNSLVQTYVDNATGLDESPLIAGAQSSVYDVATLLTLTISLAPDTSYQSTKAKETFITKSGKKIIANNTNELTKEGYSFLLSKTGTTELAGANLAVVLKDGSRVFAIVLCGSTKERRFSDMRTLIEFARTLK
ncbi:MAG: hypothetical protein QM526_02415 [Alphaproteobacteria bacterium]|nr:hypothetical protein [Alphaproteobacteria bacterium]